MTKNIKHTQPTGVFAKTLTDTKTKQQAEANKKEKYVEVQGKRYKIVRWNVMELFARLPTIANLIYVPIAAPLMESADETGIDPIALSRGDMLTALWGRFQDMGDYFPTFMASLLDQVYLEGKDTPIDVNEEFDYNPVAFVEVVGEVLQANFTMQLITALFNLTPNILAATEMNLTLNQ